MKDADTAWGEYRETWHHVREVRSNIGTEAAFKAGWAACLAAHKDQQDEEDRKTL